MSGSKIYHIRWCLGFTQKKMAKDLGISLYAFQCYENDKKPMPSDIKMKMQKHLKKFSPWMNL